MNYLRFNGGKIEVLFMFFHVFVAKMRNYMQHVGLTAWRKKSSLLLAVALVAIILFGLHYTQSADDNKIVENDEDKAPAGVIQALIQNSNSVKFVDTEQQQQQKIKLQSTERTVAVSAIREKLKAIREKATHGSVYQDVYETDQQLGIPFVNLDMKKPYIPKKRIVHLDLKGAPPRIGFLKRFFPMLKNMGATGILLGKINVVNTTAVKNVLTIR